MRLPTATRRGRRLVLGLLLCLLPLGVWAQPPSPGDDSIRARLKACLLAGDMACVVDQYLLLQDAGRVPGWLVSFQNAFSAASRKAGECERVARTIHEGLSKLGQRPEIVRFTVEGGTKLLGFNEISNGVLIKSHQLALTGQHVAVKWGGTSYRCLYRARGPSHTRLHGSAQHCGYQPCRLRGNPDTMSEKRIVKVEPMPEEWRGRRVHSGAIAMVAV